MSSETPTAPTSTRLASLDALRGFDMFWIMGASTILGVLLPSLAALTGKEAFNQVRSQLNHVPWDGFHFIDLIFPLFLFMIGVAIPYSFAKRLTRGDSRLRIFGHVLVRVAILIVLGMTINGNLLTLDPAKFQITYSVLQMLALGYLLASILFLNLRLGWQIVATIAMLVIYWALPAFVPGPGQVIGQFKPHCNFGDWLNDWILGDLQGPWRFGWILGILGHASTAMLGVFAGQLLRSSASNARKVEVLILLGGVCLALGYAWSGWMAKDFPGVVAFGKQWQEWPIWYPIVKNRWTSTFALYAGGISYLLLSFFYLVIDVWGFRRWAVPFMAIGANSIFAYMAWGLGNSAFRQAADVLLGGLRQYTGVWYDAIAWAGAMAILWILLGYMYRNKTFVRV